jgi:hypothetical protein
MCHNGRKIQEHFNWKTLMTVLHPVYSRELLPYNFSFFGPTKERAKSQITKSEDNPEDELTGVWGIFRGNLLESKFCEWMPRFELMTEHEENYSINPDD